MLRRQKVFLFWAFNMALELSTVFSKSSNSEIAEILHRPIRALTFPDSSNMAIFAALAIPLEEPYQSISVAYFFEADYGLPSNATYEFEAVGLNREIKRRSIDRRTVYQVLENKFESSGYRGRDCLLRAICETSEYPLKHNGLIGDILHIILTTFLIGINNLILDNAGLMHRCRPNEKFAVNPYGLRLPERKVHCQSPGTDAALNVLIDDRLTFNYLETRGNGLTPLSTCLFLLEIFFALGVPVDIPDKSVLFSLYFEANYGLPGEWNSSYYGEEEYLEKRSLDRQLAYNTIINKLNSFGYSGESCLLKMICEAATDPLTGNGVLGDVLQIVLTPSSSRDENLPNKFTEAEYAEDCNTRYKNCPSTPLALISYYVPNNNR